MQAAQCLHLVAALVGAVVFQVRGHHPHQAQRRVAHGHHQAAARHADHAGFGPPRQAVLRHFDHRQARGHQIAKGPVPALGIKALGGGGKAQLPPRQQRAQLRHLVARPTLQAIVAYRHFLQAQHVQTAVVGSHRQRVLHDPLRTDHAVQPAAPLHIPRQDLHCQDFLKPAA